MTTGREAGARTSTPIDGAPSRARLLLLTGLLVAAALASAGAGFVLSPVSVPDSPRSLLARLGVAVGVIMLAQLARLRVRVGIGMINVAWGEAALIISLFLVPAGWVPGATLVGAALAWIVLSVSGDHRPALDVAHIAASLSVAAALATVVTTAVHPAYGSEPTPAVAGALVLGSLVYLVATVSLAMLSFALRTGNPVTPMLVPTLRGKLLMVVGNVVVGLVVIIMVDTEPRWLLLLPPALWLLQQTYGHRLRADDERRTWRALAEATSALNQLDERGVATAGVDGALALFGAELVEIDVVRPDGQLRRYRGDAEGVIVHRDDPDDEPDDGPAAPAEGWSAGCEQELVRTLVVGPVHVGELRVRFPRQVVPGQRDQAALSAFADALGAALHDAATHRELRVVTARSSYEAVHDPLTNLINRSAMLGKGDAALHQLTHDHPVALLLVDLNHFKEVNDTLGHAAGDELLQAMAVRLGALAQPGELLGRLGGDEFALMITTLVPDEDDTTALGDRPSPMPFALRRARDIVDLLTTPLEVAGVRISVEASLGVVVAGAGTADGTELLRRADIAMYQAKEGGSSIAWYDSARDAASTDQLALLAELREALEVTDQLVLALQPAVDLTTGAPTGVEALIRWNHPRRGWLNPADFVRTIEGSELLGAFTRYVVDQALAVAADWGRHGVEVPISINLSARSLLDPRLPAEVAESLRRHKVPPDLLVLEITETVVMSELEVIDEVLAALRTLGVQLAVDDFGTGFSSLTFLTRISVDELKVDRSFVTAMAESPEAAAIVRTTVDLGRELGLRVVAEGVETADQRAALAQLGCTAAQGYHFFKPMPSDKIVTVLHSLLDSAQARIFPLRADGAS
ncbi:putative bifunctional diguanylate cyclase/phosphodiesterase [Micromonospora zhanjiangensis]